jgi:hypothetical protein
MRSKLPKSGSWNAKSGRGYQPVKLDLEGKWVAIAASRSPAFHANSARAEIGAPRAGDQSAPAEAAARFFSS